MEGPAKLVVVGSLNCDLTVRVAALPAAGETVLGEGGELSAGGKGLNQGDAASAGGAKDDLVGLVGTDAFGDRLLAHATRAGIDARFIGRATGVASGVASITVAADGTNTIAVAPGANARLSPAAIDRAAAGIAAAGALLAQLETPLDTVEHALHLARQAGVLTILNPAPAQPAALALCPLVDIITPNQPELELLSGLALDGSDTRLREAMAVLVARGASTVVATLGGDGCAALDGEHFIRMPVFPTTVLDTTGAGDTFSGMLAASLAAGTDLQTAMRTASAAAAISVSRASAEGAAPSASEIAAFLAMQQDDAETNR